MRRIVFHIGRGGRFHNAGHKTYSFCIDSLSELLEYTGCCIKTKDEDGKELPDEEWAIIDECEEEVLKGREAIESDCIKIDIDGDFDTYVIKPLEECDDEELSILADEYFDNTLEDDDIEFNYELLGLITDDDMHRQLRRKNSRLNRNEEYLQLAKKIIEDDFLLDKNGNIYFSGDYEKSRAIILKELINGYAYCVKEGKEEYLSLVPLFGFTVGHTKKIYPKKIYRIVSYRIAFLEDM